MNNLREFLEEGRKLFDPVEEEHQSNLQKSKESDGPLEKLRANPSAKVQKTLRDAGIDPEKDPRFLEAIVGENNLMSITYFQRALKVSRTVARIVQLDQRSGRMRARGSGFLVGQDPPLLMTNNHVLPSDMFARSYRAEFDYDTEDAETSLFSFAPDQFFVTNHALDYTVLALQPVNPSGTELSNFGYNTLTNQNDNLWINQRVSIIQHPGGLPKMIAVRDNQIASIESEQGIVTYSTDTQPGSSGSLVANDRWEIIALHSRAIPKVEIVDGKKKYPLRKGGYYQSKKDKDYLIYEANLGFMMGDILKDLSSRPLAKKDHAPIREELLAHFFDQTFRLDPV